MKRVLLSLVLVLAATLPALADAIADQVVANLRAQGYTVREMSRTWLGRMWILADNGTVQREVVFNPGTGEILRDYAVLMPATAGARRTAATIARDHDNGATEPLTATASASAPGNGVTSVVGGSGSRLVGTADAEILTTPSQVPVEPLNPLP